jgi:glycine/D-amino acid oxidase-like deaminating enzyme
MRLLREHYALDYEQTSGLLQLFRSHEELALAQPLMALLEEAGVAHRLLPPDDARRIEPALAYHTPLNSALHLPGDEAGNCPLFTRQLKAIAQDMGVVFHFDSQVADIAVEGAGVGFRVGAERYSADAVVIAAGHAEAGLEAAGRVIQPGVDDFTVAGTGFHAYCRMRFHHQHLAPGLCQPARHCQADHAGAYHHAIYLIHNERG